LGAEIIPETEQMFKFGEGWRRVIAKSFDKKEKDL
jgi:hypothetical protein